MTSIIFLIIFLWGVYLLVMELALQGWFGTAFQTYSAFGKVNKKRDLHLKKCLAFYNAERYSAKLERYDIISFFDTTVHEIDNHRGSFNIADWNAGEFGYTYDRMQFGTFGSPIFRDIQNKGTISFETRRELWVLANIFQGTPLDEVPVQKKLPVLTRLKRKFKKEEVQLS